MPTYTVGFSAAAVGSAAAYATAQTNATRRMYLREQGWFTTGATSTSIGFGVPANTPSTPFTSFTPQAHDGADAASTVTVGTAWTTAPTVPTTFWRKVTLGAAVGAGVIWKVALDERWIRAVSTFFVWWNHGGSTSAAIDAYLESDE